MENLFLKWDQMTEINVFGEYDVKFKGDQPLKDNLDMSQPNVKAFTISCVLMFM